MLKQRVITAVALLAVLLPCLFASSPMPFALCALVLIALAGWEWARLNGVASVGAVSCGLACAAVCAGIWQAGWAHRATPSIWLVVGPLWVVVGVWLMQRGVARWSSVPQWLRLTAGLALLVAAWLAVAQARGLGVGFLLSALLLVWVADVAAYFGGKGLSARFPAKLAPAISPGKTWVGAISGALGVLILAGVCVAFEGPGLGGARSIFSSIYSAMGPWVLILTALFLSAMSVVGDLIESLVKRSAGAKDSSQLLPGHGGVLDRVDAILPTLPLVMMLSTWVV